MIEKYPPDLQNRLTFSRELALPTGLDQPQAIFLHPGEPVFDSIVTLFLGEFADEGNRGAVYFDPQTDEPYLFYLAKVPIVRQIDEAPQVLDEVLAGIKRFSDERCELTPAHLLLTLTPQSDKGSSISPEWVDRADEVEPVKTFVVENLGAPKVSRIRDVLQSQLKDKKKQIKISFNLRKSELLGQRINLKDAVAKGVPAAQTKLNNCDRELDELEVKRAAAETSLVKEIENTELGTVTLYVRALVLPPPIDAVPTKTIRDAEAVALRTTIEYEREQGAAVEDVSNPHLKKGFDLQSRCPNGEVRYIEVKGRTGITSVELTANEWRQAANHRDRYWLYVVYHCDATPQLYRCRDPFGNLIAKAKGSVIINASDIMRESVS